MKKKVEKKKGVGRPNKVDIILTPENLIRIQGWCRDGLTDEQIAKNLSIAHSTLSLYKSKYSELSEALKKNKDVADREIENALFNKAKSGDTTAMIFWLKNRKPEQWREKQEIHNTGNITIQEIKYK